MMRHKFGFNGIFTFVDFYRENGIWKIRWLSKTPNLTLDAALTDNLSIYFNDGTKKPDWYIGLKTTNETPAAGWTAASVNVNFTEFTYYSELERQPWVIASPASKQVGNSASPAEFNISGIVSEPGTLWGGFLISDSAKNGIDGIMWACANLPIARSVYNDDIIKVIYIINNQDV